MFVSAPVRDKEHIAQKPDAVLAWILEIVPPGALVVDPFMGSGTTLRAAALRGFDAIGIDSDERYCEIAARSLSQGALEFSARTIRCSQTSADVPGRLFDDEILR